MDLPTDNLSHHRTTLLARNLNNPQSVVVCADNSALNWFGEVAGDVGGEPGRATGALPGTGWEALSEQADELVGEQRTDDGRSEGGADLAEVVVR